MNSNIHIVLDSISAADDTALIHNPRVSVLRLVVRHGDLEWIDGERSVADLFSMVETSGKLPQTSQPPVGNMLELLTELVQQGKQVIFLTVDSILSGTYQTACMAAAQVMKEVKGADIRVVDSKTAACPICGMAQALLQATANGMDLDAAEALAQDMVRRTESYFTVNTLEYLHKGGRIGAVGALIGGILGIRPIVHLDPEGKLEIADKCRTRKKVLKRMLEMLGTAAPFEELFVAHAAADEDAEAMKAQLEEMYPGVPVMLTGIGTVLAAHLGPGVLGIFGRRKA